MDKLVADLIKMTANRIKIKDLKKVVVALHLCTDEYFEKSLQSLKTVGLIRYIHPDLCEEPEDPNDLHEEGYVVRDIGVVTQIGRAFENPIDTHILVRLYDNIRKQ